MKRLLIASLAITTILASCKKDDPAPSTPGDIDMTQPTVARTSNTTNYAEPSNDVLSGDIKTNTVLKSGKTYTMNGFVYVMNGATIKIEPGVTIKGDKSSKGTLVITRNGKIDAQGTAASPIIFTSAQATPNLGDWGGIIVLGNARTNGSFNGVLGLQEIEGGVNDSRGVALHGGNNDDDNSGILKYVRVEFAGIAFQENNEINGVTFGSVGRGTTVDYLEVAYCGDDSYEWFGGTVNCSHLIAYRGTDDDFDTDNGYSGKVQFAIAVRDQNIADFATGGSSNGFESDNDANGTANTPQTSAVFSNVTLVGPWAQTSSPAGPFKRGAHIRRNSSISIFNSVFVGWKTGILIDGSATAANVNNNNLVLKNNLVAGASANKATDTVNVNATLNPMDLLLAPTNNIELTASNDAMLTNTDLVNLNVAPVGGSPALTGASFSHAKLAGMTSTTFIGAAGSGDAWWLGWTKFWNK